MHCSRVCGQLHRRLRDLFLCAVHFPVGSKMACAACDTALARHLFGCGHAFGGDGRHCLFFRFLLTANAEFEGALFAANEKTQLFEKKFKTCIFSKINLF